MVSKEFATALADDAQIQGKPLYYIANDVVRIYLKARQKGYDLGEILESYESSDLLQKVGFTFIPEALLECLVAEVANGNLEILAGICEKTGKRMGMFASSAHETPNEAIDKFSRSLSNMHFHISSQAERSALLVACPGKSIVRTSFICRFLKGFLEVFDCTIEHSDVIDGLIRIEFSRKPVI